MQTHKKKKESFIQLVFNSFLQLIARYKACPELPELYNGTVTCRDTVGGSVCDLECYEGYFFTVEDDPTPQICIDGTWSYQRLDVPFPTCEGTVFLILYIYIFTSIILYNSI